MSAFSHFTVAFENGNKAFAIRDVPLDADPATVLEALQLPPFTGVITLLGSASSMPPNIFDAAQHLFTQGLAPVAEAHRLLVVTGGTSAGCMGAMGAARQAVGGTFPLIGVNPFGAVVIPDHLDPFHSHFVFVDGDTFGDESVLLPGLLRGTNKPGVALLINIRANSPILIKELPLHARWSDVLITVRHSGGAADAVLDSSSDTYALLPAGTVVEAVDLDQPEALSSLLKQIFAPHLDL
jgi:hypothetical protein